MKHTLDCRESEVFFPDFLSLEIKTRDNTGYENRVHMHAIGCNSRSRETCILEYVKRLFFAIRENVRDISRPEQRA
jgi:hypothetical protein